MSKDITPYILYEVKDAGNNDAEIIIAFPDLRANYGRVNCGILECTVNDQCFRSSDEVSLDYINEACRKILPSTYEKWKWFISGYFLDMNIQNDDSLAFKRLQRLQYRTLRTKAWARAWARDFK